MKGTEPSQLPQPPLPKPAPLSRLNTETKQNNAAEEVFIHIASLQSEIERLAHENAQLRTSNSTLSTELEACKDTMTAQAQTIRAQETERVASMAEAAKLNHELTACRYRSRERDGAVAAKVAALESANRSGELTPSRLGSRDRDSAVAAKLAALESQHEEDVVEMQREHASTLRDRDARIEALKSQHEEIVRDHRGHAAMLHDRDAQLEALRSAHEEQINNLQSHHASTLRDLDSKITTLNSDHEFQLKALQHQHASTLLSLSTELSTLKTAHSANITTLQRTVQDLQTSQTLLSSTQQRLTDTEAAAEAREDEWRGRIELLFKEREKMSKALMTAWGRDEMGDGSVNRDMERGQIYRYRYKVSKGNENVKAC